MKTYPAFTAAAAVAAFLAFGPDQASALDFKFNGPSASDGFRQITTGSRGGTSIAGTLAGGFSFTDETPPSGALGDFVAWCFDLDTNFTSGQTYTYAENPGLLSPTPPYTADALARVQKLFDRSYNLTLPTNRDQSAGFQIAIWELLYDDDYDLSEGNFTVTAAAGSALAAAEGFLSDLATWSGPTQWVLTLYDGSGGNPKAQSVGVATPIPLPAAAWLLLAASGGLIVAKRRRNQIA